MKETLSEDRESTRPLLPQFAPIDQDAKRRSVLAKVYALLIRLAEEAENASKASVVAPNEETAGEPTSSSAEDQNQESGAVESPETLNSEAPSSEPLQNNIPS